MWHHLLTDLADRGLLSPLLIVSNRAKGLISVAEQVFPRALRQRCTIHKLRNAIAKTSKDDQEQVRADFWACFDTSDEKLKDIAPGQQLVEAVQRRIDAFIEKLADTYRGAGSAGPTACTEGGDAGAIASVGDADRMSHLRDRHAVVRVS